MPKMQVQQITAVNLRTYRYHSKQCFLEISVHAKAVTKQEKKEKTVDHGLL
jgi:hypothetical protein